MKSYSATQPNLMLTQLAWILFSFSLLKLALFIFYSPPLYFVVFNTSFLFLPIYQKLIHGQPLVKRQYALSLIRFNASIFIFHLVYDFIFLELHFQYRFYAFFIGVIINAVVALLGYLLLVNYNFVRDEK
jgi:hypothetical protein